MNSQFDRLDDIAKRMAGGDDESYGVLSTGERLYVVLAANRFDVLNAEKYTFAEAIARLGPEWTAELVERWQSAVDPRKALAVDS